MLTILILIIFIILSLIALLMTNVNRVKEARIYGVKLEKKNFYYSLITKVFIKDLPN